MKIIINITHPSGYVQEVTVENLRKLNTINQFINANMSYKVTKAAAEEINQAEFFEFSSFCLKYMATLTTFSLGSLPVDDNICKVIETVVTFSALRSVTIMSPISDELIARLLKTIEAKKVGAFRLPILLFTPSTENEKLKEKLSNNREFYQHALNIARGYIKENITFEERFFYAEVMKHEEEPFSSLPNFRSKEQDINFDRCNCIVM